MKVQNRKQTPTKCNHCNRVFKNAYSAGAHKPHCLGTGYKFSTINCAWSSGKNVYNDCRVRSLVSKDELFVKNSKAKRGHIKRIALTEGLLQNVCALCGLKDSWNEKMIVLQIDHVNGISDDHRLENLRMLCPNCHSQTKTYCRKNRKREYLTDEQILDVIKIANNIFHVTQILGISPNNTGRIKSLMIENCLTFSSYEIERTQLIQKQTIIKEKKLRGQKKQILLEKLIKSDIQFEKYGWAVKASKILEITPQNVSRWMKRMAPEFYEQRCFKRRSQARAA